MMKPRGRQTMLGAVLVLTSGFIGFAGAQASDPPDSGNLVFLLPSLRTAPAPAWIKLGIRFTYSSASAVIQGGAKYHFVEDPDGNWVDEQGRRYKAEALGTGSGYGFTVVTVAALDGTVAVLDVRNYTLTDSHGIPVAGGSGGAVTAPGAGLDWWASPGVLASATNVSGPGLKVLRTPYSINGRQYQAIRFQLKAGFTSGSWVYDLPSGLLLHSGTATQGQEKVVAKGGSADGTTTLGQNTLANSRTPNIPWALGAAPDWVRRTRTLGYQGTLTVFAPGQPPVPLRVSTRFQLQGAGANWARYIQNSTQEGGMPTQVLRAFGSAQFGGLWIPPQGLAQLRPGQMLDADPITRVTVSVGQIERTSQGTDGVWITEANQGFRADYLYDRASGVMLSLNATDNILHMQTRLRLVHRQ